MNHNVYILREINGNRTYVGYTNNLDRRIRQHNGEIKGGAKYTQGKKWEYAAYISGFPNNIIALQFEWKLKHSGIKYSGMKGRLESLKTILQLEKLTSNSTINNNELNIELFIRNEYLPIELQNITINSFDEKPH